MIQVHQVDPIRVKLRYYIEVSWMGAVRTWCCALQNFCGLWRHRAHRAGLIPYGKASGLAALAPPFLRNVFNLLCSP